MASLALSPSSTVPQNSCASTTNLDEDELKKPYEDLVSTLPSADGWVTKAIFNYRGFWCLDFTLPVIISLEKNFHPRPNQTLLTSYPKSGTTWFRAIVFAITNRHIYSVDDAAHPLLTKSPHECVRTLEFYGNVDPKNSNPDLPVVATHIPYSSLPKHLIDSYSKIVYVARNPKSVLLSFWHMSLKLRVIEKLPPLPLEVAFEMFCNGVSPWGSYWDHVLGFWKASLEFPERILFLHYEDMKENPAEHMKRLAEFLGHPFSPQEVEQGAVEKIINFCSFEKLSEANKTGVYNNGVRNVPKDVYFRKGEVGDWKNGLSDDMVERLNEIATEKFKGSGFTPYMTSISK